MDATFDFEFHSELPVTPNGLRDYAEERLLKIAGPHRDMIGASVALEPVASAETLHQFRARVVAYVRPSNLAAVEKADTPEGALKGALDALERQVRERREGMSDRQRRSQSQ